MPVEMMPVIAGGLIGGSITMMSWFVTDIQRRRDATRSRLAEFIQRQVYELYSPLHALAKLDVIYRNTRTRVCEATPAQKRLTMWAIYTDEFVVPTQLKIYELLQTKWYLIV